MASTKIKEFFNGRFFEIPKYQRGYAWEISNVRDLFDDLVESIESSSNHYIGTIVLSKCEDDDEKFFIVDGQQRITTLTMLIAVLIKSLPEKDAAFYERFYLKEETRYRLTPLNRDREFFISLLEGSSFSRQGKISKISGKVGGYGVCGEFRRGCNQDFSNSKRPRKAIIHYGKGKKPFDLFLKPVSK